MMFYSYKCPDNHYFEVRKPVKDFDKEEYCHCGKIGTHVISKPMVIFKDPPGLENFVEKSGNFDQFGNRTKSIHESK
jgi:hypothetical protein